MRELLFRGKATHGLNAGKWIYGYYVKDFWMPTSAGFGILPIDKDIGGYCEVSPDTVGQYTGLTDKNGKKIFEGDIIKTETDLWSGETKKERVTRIGVVVYDNKFCQFGLNVKGFSRCWTLKRWKGDFNEVIGNIHDNPEMLKNEETQK